MKKLWWIVLVLVFFLALFLLPGLITGFSFFDFFVTDTDTDEEPLGELFIETPTRFEEEPFIPTDEELDYSHLEQFRAFLPVADERSLSQAQQELVDILEGVHDETGLA